MTKRKVSFGWLLCAIFCLLGFCILVLPAYHFSAFLAFGLAFLALCYQLLSILARHRRKAAAVLRTMLTILLCIVLLGALITGILVVKGSYGSPQTACDYIIVLGAGVNGTVPSLSLQDRLIAAKAYLEANPDTICIVSGGQGPGEQITEAACMANWLKARGIDENRIWLEEQATSTQENLAYSLALIEARTGSRPGKAGIVSSEYHLFRAGLMAQRQNLQSIGIPAATHRTSLRINYFLREIAAVWYYLVFGG